jgi:FlaA1/EpsC-like NDP-sugar epimerase
MRKLLTQKQIGEFCIDLAIIIVSALAVLLIVQKGVISTDDLGGFWIYLAFALPFTIVTNIMVRVNRQIWEFVSISGLIRIFLAVFCTQAACVIAGNMTGMLFSFSFYFLNLFLVSSLLWGFRARSLVKRKFANYINRIESQRTPKIGPYRKKILLVGAGEAAAIFLRDFENNRHNAPFQIVGMVDDDKKKIGKVLHGVAVLGACSSVLELSQKYKVDDIVIAIPSATAIEMSRILKLCRSTACKVRVMPFLNQIGTVKPEDLHANLKELIGRPEYTADIETVQKLIAGKKVLVTGGGGSIGSELCRQIMQFGPAKLIIVDLYENSTYDLYKELVDKYGPDGYAILEVRIFSILDEKELEGLFSRYAPELVFHAAAYKHVPLMEICPKEAVRNNIFGTYFVAAMAARHKVQKFLLISTDKAVNPTNIMGATKRAAELIVVALQRQFPGTEFVAVRFGNVLGSNGSVLVQFKRQINMGGPVTVTHPDIIRYFMTIREAVSLVLEAMSFAHGGELYVLDMGSPVKIDSLARRMIEISGMRPGVDIQIAYTGLRPGEKLYEELLIEEEGILKTNNDKIFVTHPKDVGMDFIKKMMLHLGECIQGEENVKETLKLYIDTFREQDTGIRKPSNQKSPEKEIS